jgi:RNA ligase (TIGR02306 family)
MKIDNQNVYTAMFNKYNIMNKLQGRNLAIQGEICGPGIQGNRMGLKELELFVFNIFDLDDRKYLNYNDFVNMVEELGLQSVPVIDTFVFNHTMDGLLQMATELYYPNGNRAEGMVIRPVVERHSNVLHGRTSVKIVNDLYLLENKE